MSESKDEFKKENENLKSIFEQENKLSRDTPAMVNCSYLGQCPRCGNYVNGPTELYCSRCGQALLWPSFPKTDRESAKDSLGRKTDQPDLTGETEEKEKQDSEQQAQGDPNDDGPFLKVKL